MVWLRNILFFSFAVLLLSAISGCRLSGYGNSDQISGLTPDAASIAGTVTLPPTASIRASGSGKPAEGAKVWIESRPDLFAFTNENGRFTITNLPPGTYRFVARHEDEAGNVFKQRSAEISVQEVPVEAEELSVVEASYIVKIRMFDADGAALPKGTKLYVWGEEYEIEDDSGNFTVKLPPLDAADLMQYVVMNLGQADQKSIAATLPAEGGESAAIELTFPSGNSDQNGDNPDDPADPGDTDAPVPVVKLSLIKFVFGENIPAGAFQTQDEISAGTTLVLQLDVSPTSIPNENIKWTVSKGTLGENIEARFNGKLRLRDWTAPDAYPAEPAIITVEVTNGGKTTRAELSVPIDTPPSFIVRYEGNGSDETGSWPPADSTHYNWGMTANVQSAPNLTKSGHKFVGWNTLADGSGVAYQPGDSFVVTKDHTKYDDFFIRLYALWEKVENTPRFVVSYNGNGALYNSDRNLPAPIAYDPDTVVTIADKSGLSHLSKAFGGWNTSEDGSGDNYKQGETVTLISNLNLFANWVTPVKITYNANGNTGGNISQDGHLYAPGDKALLQGNESYNNLTKTGYRFGGWNTKADGTGTQYAAHEEITITENLTLYIRWIPQ